MLEEENTFLTQENLNLRKTLARHNISEVATELTSSELSTNVDTSISTLAEKTTLGWDPRLLVRSEAELKKPKTIKFKNLDQDESGSLKSITVCSRLEVRFNDQGKDSYSKLINQDGEASRKQTKDCLN